jgi:WD40 repeat protein
VVQAGLLPYLRGGFLGGSGSRWRIVIFRPGTDPLGRLAAALCEPKAFGSTHPLEEREQARIAALMEVTLRRSSFGLVDAARLARLPKDENVVIIIDQFEELFRFASLSGHSPQDNDATAFVKLLIEAARQREYPVYVVLGLRSDFIGDCARFRDLPEAVMSGLYLIPRMTRDQRRAAITEPIRVCSGTIAPRLVNRLLNDVDDNPSQLPILQHALMRTWERWRKGRDGVRSIDLEDYAAVGGVVEALSRHAEEAFKDLVDDESRRIARLVFQALCIQDSESREARRPAKVATLAEIADVSLSAAIMVIDHFRGEGRAFLTPQAGTKIDEQSVIDISHESLIRGWGRLRRWTIEEAESAKIYLRLAQAAIIYAEAKTSLLRDPELQVALDWRRDCKPNKAWASRYDSSFDKAMDYLERSRSARDRLRDEEERERKRATRIKLQITIGSVVAAVAIVIAGALAFIQMKEAEFARTRLREAQSLRLALLADERIRAADPGTAIALALSSVSDRIGNVQPHVTWGELQLDVSLRNLHERLLLAHTAEVLTAKFSPDGAYIVTGSADGVARFWDVATGKMDKSVSTEGRMNAVAFSPNGAMMIGGSDDGKARVWNIATRQELAILKGHDAAVLDVAISPNGKEALTASADGTACVWNIQTVDRRCASDPDKHAILSAAFSPNGEFIAAGSSGGKVMLWDAATMTQVDMPPPLQEEVTSVSFSPDGNRVVASSERYVIIWKLKSWEEICKVDVGEIVQSAVFSPDGNRFVTASADNAAQVWDASDGHMVSGPYRDNPNPLEERFRMRSVSYSPDGNRLVTASDDGTARVWEIKLDLSAGEILEGHSGAVRSVVFSSDGLRVITSSEDRTARIWDFRTRKPAVVLVHDSAVFDAEFSPDGARVVTAAADGGVRIWNAKTGRLIDKPFVGHPKAVNTASFSPTGQRLVTASEDGSAIIWDAETGQAVGRPLLGHAGPVRSAFFSPNGKYVLTVGFDKTARIWLADTGTQVAVLSGSRNPLRYAVYSPDGRLVVTASADQTAHIWDAETHIRKAQLIGHRGFIRTVSFSPDGRKVLTSSADETARLWDADSGEQISEPIGGDDGEMWAAVFSRDGSSIVTAAQKAVRIWHTSANIQALVNDAKLAAPRCLTPNQRRQFSLPPEPELWCVDMAKWPYNSEDWKAWLTELRAGKNKSPTPN